MIATCPTHGDQEFVRCEPCAWWYCPEPPIPLGGDIAAAVHCQAVIPDEIVTPDGADVIVWPISAGHCGKADA